MGVMGAAGMGWDCGPPLASLGGASKRAEGSRNGSNGRRGCPKGRSLRFAGVRPFAQSVPPGSCRSGLCGLPRIWCSRMRFLRHSRVMAATRIMASGRPALPMDPRLPATTRQLCTMLAESDLRAHWQRAFYSHARHAADHECTGGQSQDPVAGAGQQALAMARYLSASQEAVRGNDRTRGIRARVCWGGRARAT